MRRPSGQAMLATILTVPTLLLALVLVVQLGLIMAERQRLQAALDLAALAGTAMVDGSQYGSSGQVALDPLRATRDARATLERNLALGSSSEVAGAAQVAASAEIWVVNDVPARDPFSGLLLDRPAIAIRVREPFQAGLLRLAGLTPRLMLTVTSDAELRA